MRCQPRKIENVTLVARRREHFRGFWAMFLVAELPSKRCISTQEFTRSEILPLFILGCDQQNLENFLSDFKWSGHRLEQYLLIVGQQRHTNVKSPC